MHAVESFLDLMPIAKVWREGDSDLLVTARSRVGEERVVGVQSRCYSNFGDVVMAKQ
jgi:hypothetical protein